MNLLKNLYKKYLFAPKLLYLSINLQHYTLHKFRPLFARDMFNISKSELGKGLGILLFITFFTNIFIATMSDKFGRPRAFLIGLLLVSCMFFQLFYLDGYIRFVPFMFWINLLAYLIANTTIPALLDKVVLEYLSRIQNVGSGTYGKQRSWGSVGYILCIFVVEGFLKSQNSDKKYDFTNLKYYSVVTTMVSIVFVMLFVDDFGNKSNSSRQDILVGCKELIRNKEYLFFILIIFLNGLTRAGMTMYLSVYVRDILNVRPYDLPSGWPIWLKTFVKLFNDLPFSTISVFEVFLEITILFYSQSITQAIGLFWPLLIAQIAQFSRFVFYLLLPRENPHVFMFCCLFELLKGINFGLTHGSGVQLAARMCPPHTKATSQMIYQGMFTAVSSATAGVLFGSLFREEEMSGSNATMDQKAKSFRMFFIYNAFIAGVTVLLFLYKYGIRDKILFNEHNEKKRMEGLNKEIDRGRHYDVKKLIVK